MRPTESPGRPWALVLLLLAGTAGAETFQLPAAMDTYTRSNLPDNIFGGEARIRVQTWGNMTGFLAFDVAIPARFEARTATLTLHIQQVGRVGTIEVRKVDSAWDEFALTGRQLPPLGPVATEFSVAPGDVVVEVDITDLVNELLVNRDELASIALVPRNVNAWFRSRTSGFEPILTIETRPATGVLTWPKIDCPCDSFFNRAMTVYTSAGGSLTSPEDSRNPPGFFQCDEKHPVTNDRGDVEYIETVAYRGDLSTDVSVWLNVFGDEDRVPDNRYSCSTSVLSEVSADLLYNRSLSDLSKAEYEACVVSAVDMCRDWKLRN
jgi:hypothetical protein